MINTNRYIDTYTIKDIDNSRTRLSTIILPKIDRNENDIYIQSKIGDRLDLLAYEYYKDVKLWWVIAKANNIGKGTLNIEPSLQIRIPYIS